MESQHTEQIPSVFQHALYDDLVAAWNLSRFVILVCRWMSCTSHTAQNKQQTHITYMPHSRTHHRPYRIPNFTAIRPGKCVCVCVRIVDHRIPHHLKGAECNAKCTNLTTHFVKCTFNIYFYTITYCIVGNNMVGQNIFVMYQKSRNFQFRRTEKKTENNNRKCGFPAYNTHAHYSVVQCNGRVIHNFMDSHIAPGQQRNPHITRSLPHAQRTQSML